MKKANKKIKIEKGERTKKVIFFILIIALTNIIAILTINKVTAAIIQGKVYTPDLELAKRSLVTINSTPKQNLVATNGDYSFVITSGCYEIEAFYTIQGTLLYAKETITVPEEGSFNLDLILFETPTIEEAEFDENDIKLIEELLSESFKEKQKIKLLSIIGIVIAILIAMAFVYLIIFILKKIFKKILKKTLERKLKRKNVKKERKRKVEKKKKSLIKKVGFEETKTSEEIKKPEIEFKTKLVGDELIKKTLEILAKERRINQKDLRKELNISEAKMSLIIADLEDQGKIRKIKRGRGNIIVYQE